jgi:hypothetical protein
VIKMKSIFIALILLGASALALPAQANYSYLVGAPDKDNDGDGALSTVGFSTLSACQKAAATASNVVQGCVSTCDPANSKSAMFIEQQGDNDGDSARFMNGVGPFGFLADCDSGIAAAVAAGYTDVMSECSRIQSKKACK